MIIKSEVLLNSVPHGGIAMYALELTASTKRDCGLKSMDSTLQSATESTGDAMASYDDIGKKLK